MSGNTVTVNQDVTSIVNVTAQGPQGVQGPTGPAADTGSLVLTSSFNTFTSSYTTGSFTGSFTGSLFGTSSWATNASTASFLPIGTYQITSSWANNTLTASFVTASNVRGPYGSNSILSASYALTASHALNISPSSPDRSIQFNSSNVFGGSADLTFDTGRQLNALRLNVTGRLVVQGWSKIDSSDSPYDVKTDESIIICDTSSGPIVLDINTTAVRGRILTIKDVGGAATNNITFGSAVIDGGSYTIATDKQSIIITYDVAIGEWYIIGSHILA
jgi:hypothetical protein